MPNETRSVPRPTSPHLGIYKPQISTVLSISHRITGVALVAGAALIVAWLWAAAYAPAFFGQMHGLLASPLGQICMLGWTVAFYYHLANGVRHLFWDIGMGFTLPVMHRTGWAVVFFTIIMTAFTWGYVYSAGGQ